MKFTEEQKTLILEKLNKNFHANIFLLNDILNIEILPYYFKDGRYSVKVISNHKGISKENIVKYYFDFECMMIEIGLWIGSITFFSCSNKSIRIS